MKTVNLSSSHLESLNTALSGDAIKQLLGHHLSDTVVNTYQFIIDQASEKLGSRRETFLSALHVSQESDSTWVIALDESANWIEAGMPEHSMIADLLKNGKTAKDGSRYQIIPFNHSPGSKAPIPQGQKQIIDSLKREMGKRKIPYARVEPGRTGLLHSFDFMSGPIKKHDGPWQGWGPKGKPRQGKSGTPFMQGVRVYQHMNESGKVSREIRTFRVVSSKHQGSGMWQHPGLPPANIMDDAAKHAVKLWSNKLPMLLDEILRGV